MAYFDTKSGSLEEAIRQAVGGVKTQINEASMDVNIDEGKMKELAGKIASVYKKMKSDSKMKPFADKFRADVKTSMNIRKSLEKVLPDYVGGGDITKLMGEGKLDPVNKTAVKKKFDDRKDKDIDNDGDVDSSDKFLHKRRKAISKAVGEEVSLKETVSIIESTSFSVLGILTEADKKAIKRALDAAREKENKIKKRMGDAERMGKPELADKFAQQASDAEDDVRDLEKQFRNADEDDIETASQKGVLGKKGTSAKSKEKDRRRAAATAAGPGKEKGSVAGVDRNIQKGKDAYANYVQGQREKGKRPLSRDDYMRRFGKRLRKSYESYDIGTPENTMAKLDATPGQSSDEWNQQVEMMQKKNISMREALAKVWGFEEGHNPFKKEEKKVSKKEGKTMTGQPETKVTIDPDMKEKVK